MALGPTSPFSRGTILECSVEQMTWSSRAMRSSVCGPNRSRQSLLDAVGTRDPRVRWSTATPRRAAPPPPRRRVEGGGRCLPRRARRTGRPLPEPRNPALAHALRTDPSRPLPRVPLSAETSAHHVPILGRPFPTALAHGVLGDPWPRPTQSQAPMAIGHGGLGRGRLGSQRAPHPCSFRSCRTMKPVEREARGSARDTWCLQPLGPAVPHIRDRSCLPRTCPGKARLTPLTHAGGRA